MTYERFEDLPVWQKAADLYEATEDLLENASFHADSLQNSDIKGPRHLTDKSRGEDDQKKRAASLQKELLRKLPPGHPLRKDAEERGVI